MPEKYSAVPESEIPSVPKEKAVWTLAQAIVGVQTGACTNLLIVAIGDDGWQLGFAGGDPETRQRLLDTVDIAIADSILAEKKSNPQSEH